MKIMKSFALIALAIFVVGCSGSAPEAKTDAKPTDAGMTASNKMVKCEACSAEVASNEITEKDGKKLCTKCASH
jgi:PBP1b-binding outer membrane lipoprotein LpoB